MEWWSIAYQYGWCTFEQLKEACKYDGITKEQFKEISGKEYIAE